MGDDDALQATQESGLVCGFLLDGKGGGKPIEWDAIHAHKPAKGTIWVHLDYTGPESRHWLAEVSGIDEVTREALLARDPRPRATITDKGLMLILRGVNITPGSEPEDLVSLRLFVDSHRVVTMRHRRNNASKAVRKLFARKKAPKRIGDMLVTLIDHTLIGIREVSHLLEEEVATLEDDVLASDMFEQRHQIADARRRAIALQRHIAPQRDVLARLWHEPLSWLTERDRSRLREMDDRITRILEDLDSARERAAVTQEEVASRLSEQMNKRLYVLSIITAIFMPMGLVTGLLGVNVGGMPLQQHPQGFFIIGLSMAGLLLLMLVAFRAMRWL